MSTLKPLLSVRNLVTTLQTPAGSRNAVDGISFEVLPGEAVGIVGESGSGKSMTSLSLLNLPPRPIARITAGEIEFDKQDLLRLSEKELQKVRGGSLSMIFQDALSSLSPFYSIGFQIRETILAHQDISRAEAKAKTLALLDEVGIPDAANRLEHYPHQFSGGMRQRIMIAMALANTPKLLIADEPTTALDVTIQAQILSLLADRRRERNMSLLLISHDWGVISSLCDRVIVMYAGKIVEEGTTQELFNFPRHPYTKGLLRSIPHWGHTNKAMDLPVIPGTPPTLMDARSGCSFAQRCEFASDKCRSEIPQEKYPGVKRRYLCHL